MAKKKTSNQQPDADPGAQTEPSFEEALAELEQIVLDLEGGELGLDESLQRYEAGVARLNQCRRQLQAAEQKIELLCGLDAAGNPITRPLDDPEPDEPRSRSAKRTASRGAAAVDDEGRLF